MYVKVAPAQMARSLQAFVKQSGGSTTYSAALEFVSGAFGFNNYRAQKAYAEQNKAKDTVVFETELEDWNVAECGPEASDADRPETYRLTVEQSGSQLELSIVPKDVKDRHLESSGRNALNILLEINHGLPCIHLTNDLAGEVLLTVFGHAGGLLVREDEAELESPDDANDKLAAYLREDDWEGLRWLECTSVMNSDTQAKYSGDEGPQPDASSSPVNPFTVDALFDDSVSTEPDGQWFDLTVYENGEPCDDWQVGLECRFTDTLPQEGATQFCAKMSEAFTLLYGRFKDGDSGMALHGLVQLCLAGGLAVPQRLIEVAHAHPTASYAELEKQYRMTAAVWAQALGKGNKRQAAPVVVEPAVDLWPGVKVAACFNRLDVDKSDTWYFDLEVSEGGDSVEWASSGGRSKFRFDASEKELAEFIQAMEAAFSVYFHRTGSVSGLASVESLLHSCLEAGSGLPQRLVEVARQNPEASAKQLEQLFRVTATTWLANKMK